MEEEEQQPLVITYHLIYTFDRMQQEMQEVSFEYGISEEEFVQKLLEGLTDHELRCLVKISCLQLCEKQVREGTEPWLLGRNGKFYFSTTDYVPSEDTKRWIKLKMECLAKRSRSSNNKIDSSHA